MSFLKFLLFFVVITSSFFIVNSALAATYYVDNTITDCSNYDPITFTCGAGSYQAYPTMAKIQANVTAGTNSIYIRRGQTFTEVTRFRPKAGWTIDAFGTGDRPIISFTVDYAIDIRSDAPGVYWNHLDIRTSAGNAVRLYGSGTLDLNMTDVSINASIGGIYSSPTAPLTITFNLSSTTVTAGSANAFSSSASSTYTGTITDSSFYSSAANSISFQSGIINNLTISNSSSNGSFVNGLIATTEINGLNLIDFTANNNGVSGISLLAASGKTQQNIYITGGHYNLNGTNADGNGITFIPNASGILKDITVSGIEASFNTNDGINTYGVITGLLIKNSEIHNNGVDGLGGHGDGIALHESATAVVYNNYLHDNKKLQIHAIETCNLTAYNNLIISDIDVAFGQMIWVYEESVSAFYNNTIILKQLNPVNKIFLINTNGSGGNHKIKNNIIQGGIYSIVNNSDSIPSPVLDFDYNNYYNYTIGTFSNTYGGNAADGGHSIDLDPLLLSASNYYLQPLSPVIDSGINIDGIFTDYAGNPIYGTPDIGAYEFQPPYTIGVDDINSTGNIRIYADGKYRYTTATSSDSVISFTITPEGGSFPTYIGTTTRPEWLNISDITWNTSGDYSKQWTASSSLATSTIYTIGDLLPNTDYTITVDGLASTTEKSDADGVITYTYSGGYSTHTFTVTDNTAPVAFGVPTFGSISTSSIEVIKPEVTPEDEADIYQWQVRRDGSLELGFNSTSTNSITDSGLMPNTEYVYDVQSKDRSLNAGTYGSSTSKYTLAGTPTNFSTTTVTKTSISFSVDSFPNATTSSSGYFFSRSGQDSGWIQTNVWQDTSLTCNTSYTYSVKYRNGNGVETESVSLIPKTASCSSGGGGSTVTTTTSGNPSNIYSLSDFINLLISLNIIPQDKINLAKTLTELKVISTSFTKDLEFGQIDPDVKRLQVFLNTQGFIVSTREGGVPGHETDYFGLKTKGALQRFQKAKKISPVSGYFGPKTRGVVNEMMSLFY